MSYKRLAMAGLAFSLVLIANAAAQKNEVAGVFGKVFVSDQGIKGATFNPSFVSHGAGYTVEGNIARIIKPGFFALRVEVPVVYSPDQDLNTGANLIPKDYKAYFITPSLRVSAFSEAALSPWLSVGGGYGHFQESKILNQDTPNPGKRGTGTGIFQIGGGFDVRVRGSLGLRMEVRDFYTGLPQLNVDVGKSRQHNYLVGIGAVFHF